MLLPSQPLDNSAPEGRNLVRLDALREIAKPFSYCGGQARRLIPVKTLLIAMSFFLLIFLGGVPLTSASGAQVVTEKDNTTEVGPPAKVTITQSKGPLEMIRGTVAMQNELHRAFFHHLE